MESWLLDWAKADMEAVKMQASAKLPRVFFINFLLEGEWIVRQVLPAGLDGMCRKPGSYKAATSAAKAALPFEPDGAAEAAPFQSSRSRWMYQPLQSSGSRLMYQPFQAPDQ